MLRVIKKFGESGYRLSDLENINQTIFNAFRNEMEMINPHYLSDCFYHPYEMFESGMELDLIS